MVDFARRYFCLLCLFFGVNAYLLAQHREAHAHNDYEHKLPLFNALSQGFTSVEADIYPIDGRLVVSHDKPLAPFRDLEELYLKPLWELFKSQNGQIIQGWSEPFFLLIDIKGPSVETWKILQSQLEAYRPMLDQAVKVIVSGNRPMDQILHSEDNLAALDGRPEDLEKNIPNKKMPLISENYAKVIGSFNRGIPTHEQVDKIRSLAAKVHEEGKMLRLWFSPEIPEVWEMLIRAGVDLINTDQLEQLNQFLTDFKSKN